MAWSSIKKIHLSRIGKVWSDFIKKIEKSKGLDRWRLAVVLYFTNSPVDLLAQKGYLKIILIGVKMYLEMIED